MGEQKSYGDMSDQHWSRARKHANKEALDYYRERSKAPGVAEGGEARNFYCMDCDGVVPFEHEGGHCPHCGVELDRSVRRYFNWVEIDTPPRSDLRAVLPWLLLILALVLTLVIVIFGLLFGGNSA